MIFLNFILFFCIAKGGQTQTTQFRPVRKKMGELLCLCTFLLCICLTVLRSIYLTGHAYVCGQE